METKMNVSPFRVVVVDDHKEYIRPLAYYMEKMPDLHLVGTAHDGAEALEVIRATKPDVVLMDLVLRPEMNGAEVIRRILEEHRKIHILAYTGYADEDLLLQALQAGASGYYLKGSGEFDDLVGAIRRVAKGESVFIGRGLPPVKPSADLERSAYAWDSLSPSEIRMLKLAAKNMSNEEICAQMNIKETTSGNYRRAIREKLGLAEWHQAVLAYWHRMLREGK